jgi:hypothetical protein
MVYGYLPTWLRQYLVDEPNGHPKTFSPRIVPQRSGSQLQPCIGHSLWLCDCHQWSASCSFLDVRRHSMDTGRPHACHAYQLRLVCQYTVKQLSHSLPSMTWWEVYWKYRATLS